MSDEKFASPPAPILHYFDGRGLAEVIRLFLAAIEVDFAEKVLVEKQCLESLRERGLLLFGQVPLVEVDGLNLVQSMAIMRYFGTFLVEISERQYPQEQHVLWNGAECILHRVLFEARKYDRYGKTRADEALCDMYADGARDFVIRFVAYVFSPNREAALEELRVKWAPKYLPRINDALLLRDGPFLLGDSLSFADIVAFECLEYCDELLGEEWKTEYPAAAAMHKACHALPGMIKYFATRRRAPGWVGSYVEDVNRILGR